MHPRSGFATGQISTGHKQSLRESVAVRLRSQPVERKRYLRLTGASRLLLFFDRLFSGARREVRRLCAF